MFIAMASGAHQSLRETPALARLLATATSANPGGGELGAGSSWRKNPTAKLGNTVVRAQYCTEQNRFCSLIKRLYLYVVQVVGFAGANGRDAPLELVHVVTGEYREMGSN